LNDVGCCEQDTFNMDGRQWGRGTTIIELNDADLNRLTQAAESLGLVSSAFERHRALPA
jgi:hypothetical protein